LVGQAKRRRHFGTIARKTTGMEMGWQSVLINPPSENQYAEQETISIGQQVVFVIDRGHRLRLAVLLCRFSI
jgi:hypothetical protein